VTYQIHVLVDWLAGARTLSLIIKPYSAGVWRAERRYFISVCSVHSNSSLTDDGQISPTAGTLTIVVRIYTVDRTAICTKKVKLGYIIVRSKA